MGPFVRGDGNGGLFLNKALWKGPGRSSPKGGRRAAGYSNPLIANFPDKVTVCTYERTASHRRDADGAAGRSGIWARASSCAGDAWENACRARYISGLPNYLLSWIYDWRRRGRSGRHSCDSPVFVLHAIREHAILVDASGARRANRHASRLLVDHPAGESLLAARSKAWTHELRIFFDRSEEVARQQ